MILRPLCIAVCLAIASQAMAIDEVVFRRDGKELDVSGRVLIEAQDNGLLLQGTDGLLWLIPPEDKIKHTSDSTPFRPASSQELAKELLKELPPGFGVLETTHYVIFYDTSKVYAEWCGSLFEGLYRAFTNYWTHKGFELSKPEFPLVAVVFANRQEYLKYAKPELGDAGDAIIGYFALLTNRMTMFDLTESQGTVGGGSKKAQINQILSQPKGMQTVSTIVHEATHQIAFNCGLHTRLSDCPVWFCEGIAEFFETPDLQSTKGWNRIGVVNRTRLELFLHYSPNRPANSLETLIRDDKRFHDTKLATDAYAEAWALTNFLLKQRPKEYVAYLQMLSKKKPLIQDSPQTRIDEFRKAFGELDKLDSDFMRYMSRYSQ